MQRKRLLTLVVLLALGALTVFLSIPAEGIRPKARYLADYAQAALHRQDVLAYTRGEYTNIVFLHHSVGRNLIRHMKSSCSSPASPTATSPTPRLWKPAKRFTCGYAPEWKPIPTKSSSC